MKIDDALSATLYYLAVGTVDVFLEVLRSLPSRPFDSLLSLNQTHRWWFTSPLPFLNHLPHFTQNNSLVLSESLPILQSLVQLRVGMRVQ